MRDSPTDVSNRRVFESFGKEAFETLGFGIMELARIGSAAYKARYGAYRHPVEAGARAYSDMARDAAACTKDEWSGDRSPGSRRADEPDQRMLWAKYSNFPFWPARLATSAERKRSRAFQSTVRPVAVFFFGADEGNVGWVSGGMVFPWHTPPDGVVADLRRVADGSAGEGYKAEYYEGIRIGIETCEAQKVRVPRAVTKQLDAMGFGAAGPRQGPKGGPTKRAGGRGKGKPSPDAEEKKGAAAKPKEERKGAAAKPKEEKKGAAKAVAKRPRRSGPGAAPPPDDGKAAAKAGPAPAEGGSASGGGSRFARPPRRTCGTLEKKGAGESRGSGGGGSGRLPRRSCPTGDKKGPGEGKGGGKGAKKGKNKRKRGGDGGEDGEESGGDAWEERKRRPEEVVADEDARCVVCGEGMDEDDMVICDCCNLDYHYGCTFPRFSNEVGKQLGQGWYCQRCCEEVCGACGKSTTQGDVVMCDGCNRDIHFECGDPPLTKEDVDALDLFLCSLCRISGVTKEEAAALKLQREREDAEAEAQERDRRRRKDRRKADAAKPAPAPAPPSLLDRSLARALAGGAEGGAQKRRSSDACDVCLLGGCDLKCAFEGCPAVFHHQCVGMARGPGPAQRWVCPAHHCARCSRQEALPAGAEGAEERGGDAVAFLSCGECGYALCEDCDAEEPEWLAPKGGEYLCLCCRSRPAERALYKALKAAFSHVARNRLSLPFFHSFLPGVPCPDLEEPKSLVAVGLRLHAKAYASAAAFLDDLKALPRRVREACGGAAPALEEAASTMVALATSVVNRHGGRNLFHEVPAAGSKARGAQSLQRFRQTHCANVLRTFQSAAQAAPAGAADRSLDAWVEYVKVGGALGVRDGSVLSGRGGVDATAQQPPHRLDFSVAAAAASESGSVHAAAAAEERRGRVEMLQNAMAAGGGEPAAAALLGLGSACFEPVNTSIVHDDPLRHLLEEQSYLLRRAMETQGRIVKYLRSHPVHSTYGGGTLTLGEGDALLEQRAANVHLRARLDMAEQEVAALRAAGAGKEEAPAGEGGSDRKEEEPAGGEESG